MVNLNDIDSINVFKNAAAASKMYEESNPNGVVEVVLINKANLINYEQLLKKFNIPNSESKLPVYIDSAIAFQPQKTYFELSAIKTVTTDIEKNTGMIYISILTIFPVKQSKKDGGTIIGRVADIK